MTEPALRDRVAEALRNADANGVDFSGWTAQEIAADRVDLDADLEDQDPELIAAIVIELRGGEPT